jgi:hypothetical protein
MGSDEELFTIIAKKIFRSTNKSIILVKIFG